LVENAVQALARLVLAEAMVKMSKKYKVALVVHDEVVLVVPDDQAELALEYAKKIMCQSPEWAPDLPLEAEGYISQRYTEERAQETTETRRKTMVKASVSDYEYVEYEPWYDPALDLDEFQEWFETRQEALDWIEENSLALDDRQTELIEEDGMWTVIVEPDHVFAMVKREMQRHP
jgi:hypothetical protein